MGGLFLAKLLLRKSADNEQGRRKEFRGLWEIVAPKLFFFCSIFSKIFHKISGPTEKTGPGKIISFLSTGLIMYDKR